MILGGAGSRRRRRGARLPGGPGRHGARIDRIEIAAGRQDIEAAARRRAGGARCDEAPVERSDQRRALPFGAGFERGERFARRVRAGEIAISSTTAAAINMQAVADAHVLDVAEPGVEPGQRFGAGVDSAAFLRETGFGRALEDDFRE